MDWHTPTLADLNILWKAAANNDCVGNDCNPVNLVFYRKKFCTEIALCEDFLFRRYFVGGELLHCAPLAVEGEADFQKQKAAFARIDAKKFAMLTDAQKDAMAAMFGAKFSFEEDRSNFDYVYGADNLASLSGKAYQKKRGHVNKFTKLYPDFSYASFSPSNPLSPVLVEAIKSVEDGWLKQACEDAACAQADAASFLSDYSTEKDIISDILLEGASLPLQGGVLFVAKTPVAFCVASATSAAVIDVHFEKAVEPFAKDGGYALINQLFAKSASSFKKINREEDLGIEGLRKAKLSYHPELLRKWTACAH